MECSICFKKIENSCIGSCTHHFCYVCLTHWCYMGGIKCPICQTPIYEIRLDREFDMINGSPSTPINAEFLKKINVQFSSIKPGITLVKNKGPGVKIKSLKHNEQCYLSGLREGDIIMFIGGVPCVNHKDVVFIIDNAFLCKKLLGFDLLIKRQHF